MPTSGICDVCAADINPGEGKRFTPGEFRLLATRGFAPPRSALRPHDPSMPYEKAVVWWRDHLVAESDTDWALCDACTADAARYETTAPPAGPEGAVSDLDTYLALIHRQFSVARERKDGTPVTGMSAEEIALVKRLVADASKPENADHFRAYYELPSTADAHVVTLLGWRLYLQMRAASSNQPLIFAAPDTAGMTLSARSMRVLAPLECHAWGDVAKVDQRNPGRLDGAILVGDLDVPQTGAGKLLMNYDGTISAEQTIAFVMARAARAEGVSIFFHRAGWSSPFDLQKISAALAAPPKTRSSFWARISGRA